MSPALPGPNVVPVMRAHPQLQGYRRRPTPSPGARFQPSCPSGDLGVADVTPDEHHVALGFL
jgi:hypothetical protein